MQRFTNKKNQVVEDMAEGFVKAYDYIEYAENSKKVLKYSQSKKGKVGLVSGGGSGHEPAFIGYIGKNMLDAVALGEVFSSPPAVAFYDAFVEVDNGAGVACLFGNYAGDNMNVKMAMELAADDDIEVKCVVAKDDISSSSKATKDKRHGIAGGVFMWKVAGAKAALGGSLDEVVGVAQKAVDATRSICVGLAPCTIPDVGHPNFLIEEGTYEFGIGHHGEPGMAIRKLQDVDVIVQEMMECIDQDDELLAGDEVAVIVSGLGATPIMEQYIIYNEVEQYLTKKNIKIHMPLVGNFVTSLDMNGVAITVMKVDDELKELLAVPAKCPAYHW